MHETYLDEMAARLRVNPATLQYWASRDLIPAIKDAQGRYLFDEGEVLRVVVDWPPTPPTSVRRRTARGERPLKPIPLGSTTNDHRRNNDSNHG